MRSRLSVLSGVREAKSGRSSPDIPGSLNASCHLWTRPLQRELPGIWGLWGLGF